ncbi:hypothetical protein HOP50_01g07320 [Chloropicon primus]|uniref:Uncharacterized protein n=1 Tax=Chloropicon primus TaxID=1764295 RepID=A0A5B8MFW7_9CHLO|nr:hypothetical protein A3770_01p07480 [Chloropicon primus]UPQ97441.1 hypothetical protein HOP50_01g07320 [Chloropicon primus]|eukprot:QDZ18230.1 hypothetical protein A3770_01p07480 [Chloropicon primus]
MAGGSAKKLAKENGARLALLRKVIVSSEFAHFVGTVAVTRTAKPMEMHTPKGWVFLSIINLLAWFSLSFLGTVAGNGTSLLPVNLRTGTRAPAWWIENLQDLIFLIGGCNFFTVLSMKWGIAIFGLIPLYVSYLIALAIKDYLFSQASNRGVEAEEQAPEAQARKGSKKRMKVSKNRTR